jgi:hypothetical protein
MRAPDGRLFDVGETKASAHVSAGPDASAAARRAPHEEASKAKEQHRASMRTAGSAEAVTRSETRSKLGSALMKLPWKVITFDLAVAVLSATLVRWLLIPHNLNYMGVVGTLVAVVGFVVTIAHREWIQRKLPWFTSLSLISLGALVFVQVSCVGDDRILVGIVDEQTSGKDYWVMMGLYAAGYVGFVFGMVMVFGGTVLPRRDQSPP